MNAGHAEDVDGYSLKFANDWCVQVQWGNDSYSSRVGEDITSFQVQVFDAEGRNILGQSDSVTGWMSPDPLAEVMYYASRGRGRKVKRLLEKQPHSRSS